LFSNIIPQTKMDWQEAFAPHAITSGYRIPKWEVTRR
jgi:hypothetical protein